MLTENEKQLAVNCSVRLSKMDCGDGRIFIMPLWHVYHSEEQYLEMKRLNDEAITKREAIYAAQANPGVIAQEWTIPSSNGKQEYTVKLDDHGWSCTCMGFGFRKTCKHVDEIQKKGSPS